MTIRSMWILICHQVSMGHRVRSCAFSDKCIEHPNQDTLTGALNNKMTDQ